MRIITSNAARNAGETVDGAPATINSSTGVLDPNGAAADGVSVITATVGVISGSTKVVVGLIDIIIDQTGADTTHFPNSFGTCGKAFTAYAVTPLNEQKDISDAVIWSSNSVCGSISPGGMMRTYCAAAVTITATYGGESDSEIGTISIGGAACP